MYLFLSDYLRLQALVPRSPANRAASLFGSLHCQAFLFVIQYKQFATTSQIND